MTDPIKPCDELRHGSRVATPPQRSLNPRCVYSFVKEKRRKKKGELEQRDRRGLSQNINALNPLWIARCERFYARLNEAENTYVYNNWDEKNDEKMGSSIIAIVQIA